MTGGGMYTWWTLTAAPLSKQSGTAHYKERKIALSKPALKDADGRTGISSIHSLCWHWAPQNPGLHRQVPVCAWQVALLRQEQVWLHWSPHVPSGHCSVQRRPAGKLKKRFLICSLSPRPYFNSFKYYAVLNHSQYAQKNNVSLYAWLSWDWLSIVIFNISCFTHYLIRQNLLLL